MSLKFGAFMAPFHELGEDPTAALRFDLDLIEHLDELGYDEAWIGEHHSGGWSLIASPELFLAAASQRTRRIKLGTGVVSLPYHNPLSVAERMVLLDHLSQGRAMFGMGAGISPADAHMMGIAPSDQRRMMAESAEAVVALLRGQERVSMKTDWFELRDARVQLRPYTQPCFDMVVASAGSERGMRLAGQYGLGTLSFAGRPGMPDAPLDRMWAAAEDEAARNGRTVDRANWRIAICVHVADTREEALEQVRPGMRKWFREYVVDTFGAPANLTEGREVDEAVECGAVIIGSVEDAIEGIQRLIDQSGGFGTLLVNTHDWATRGQVKRSFELIRRHVVPHFTGSTDGLRESQKWVSERRGDLSAQAREASLAAKSAPDAK
ncbi:LLM class flavin-dependent oxidoreductase [Kitasatospora brasiliensis]|uniref:LLM class flavin-dependent oxidoreductase n=1 Tax=Kitasatospora brasiliensis TaxID=3058040 RepID=UPI00292ECD88|nr:LLM class flavin-dependent oxidoreductase [Kitasatospora sp. K002]